MKNRRERHEVEKHIKEVMGHEKADDAGTSFLKKHGYGPTGRKRGRFKK